MKHRHRILIVDPDIRFQRDAGSELARAGFRVLHAADARAALPIMYRMQPNLILLTLTPSHDETRETLERIRALTDNPVMVLAPTAKAADLPIGTELGTRVWVEKDATPAELPTRVQALLKQSAPPAPVKRQARASASPFIPLRHLTVPQLMQIDRALTEVGTQGEVWLVQAGGHMRILVKVATTRVHPSPASFGT